MTEASAGERVIVVGATGLVGREFVRQSLSDPGVRSVTTLVRRSGSTSHEKLTEHLIDFDTPDSWSALVQGDVLFSALGTTIRTAGSREAQFRIDHDYQLAVARAARQNGVGTYVLVSAMGADPKSSIFYSRMKGELEREVLALGFPKTILLRPGILDGGRAEVRQGERLALRLLRCVPAWSGLERFRPIPATRVARAGRKRARELGEGSWILEPRDLFAASE